MAHPKGVLIERLQKEGRQPQFKTESTGPDHEPTFLSDAIVGGQVLGTGQGGTKRDAEKRAAEEALRYLDRQERTESEPSRERKGRGKRGRKGREETPSEAPDTHAPAALEGPFEGPWPIFGDVLVAALEIANERLDKKQTGAAGIAAVRDLALDLYKGTLEDLGELVEVDEDEEEV
jgi:hypothetical protein